LACRAQAVDTKTWGRVLGWCGRGLSRRWSYWLAAAQVASSLGFGGLRMEERARRRWEIAARGHECHVPCIAVFLIFLHCGTTLPSRRRRLTHISARQPGRHGPVPSSTPPTSEERKSHNGSAKGGHSLRMYIPRLHCLSTPLGGPRPSRGSSARLEPKNVVSNWPSSSSTMCCIPIATPSPLLFCTTAHSCLAVSVRRFPWVPHARFVLTRISLCTGDFPSSHPLAGRRHCGCGCPCWSYCGCRRRPRYS
jgi:hypothetical protein